MIEYLNYTDDSAFAGLELKVPPPDSHWHKGLVHQCPKCRGFGGWILRPDAYGAGNHFKAGCMDCAGWGYVSTPVDHPHEWDSGTRVGNCLTDYKCAACGEIQRVDSSD